MMLAMVMEYELSTSYHATDIVNGGITHTQVTNKVILLSALKKIALDCKER